MMSIDERGTRHRILTEAMRLFGENGYRATSVAAIEAASGLSPGSGALYKHFRSKAELLAEGVDHQLQTNADLVEQLDDPGSPEESLKVRLARVILAGLARLDRERDLNRLMLRDLAQFPQLLDRVREQEMRRLAVAVGHWLSLQADDRDDGHGPTRDWTAIATVLTSAVGNYWLLSDVFGSHPSGVSEDAFIAALVDLAAAMLTERTDSA